jgi:hypothetical protein
MKNNSGGEKTQKAKKQGVIANPVSSLDYQKNGSSFFKPVVSALTHPPKKI